MSKVFSLWQQKNFRVNSQKTKFKNMLKFMKLKIQTWPTKEKLDCMKRFKLITKILDKTDSGKIRKGLNKI